MAYKTREIARAAERRAYREGRRRNKMNWRNLQIRLNTPWAQELRRKNREAAHARYWRDPETARLNGRCNARNRRRREEEEIRRQAKRTAQRALQNVEKIMRYGYQGEFGP